jgi:hypothetical protein
MTFISQQTFDADGNIKVIVKRRKILEVGETQEDGSVKGQARVKFEYGDLTREDLTAVGNLRAAEVMAMEEGEVFWGYSCPPLNNVAEENKLAHMISLAASNIATHSKRGFGNTIVCHPSNADRIRDAFTKEKTVKQYSAEVDDMVDMQIPYFPHEPQVFEDEIMNETQVLVIYRGDDDGDQPLIYVEGEGLLLNNKVALVEHYGKFVDI